MKTQRHHKVEHIQTLLELVLELERVEALEQNLKIDKYTNSKRGFSNSQDT